MRFETTIERALAFLRFQPRGCDADGISAALDLNIDHVRRALELAAKDGRVHAQPAPEKGRPNRRLYLAIKHCPSGQDHRHTVSEPIPHLRSMGMGRYDEGETWVTRMQRARASCA